MTSARSQSYPYRAFADAIAAKVRTGELMAGDQLPSIRKLSEQYGITTATVQKGLKDLTDEGWVTTVPGLGIFVSDTAPTEPGDEPVTLNTVMQQLDRLQAAVTDLAERVQHLEHPDAD